MPYADFELNVAAAPAGGYTLSVESPAGEASGEMQFPYDQLELRNKIQALQIALLRSGGGARAATAEDLAVQELGRDLFKALFPGQIANRFQVSRGLAGDQGLRIKLRISAPELVALPWEYLFDDERGDYLALAVDTPVVRYVPVPVEIRPLKVTPPIRILGMTAGPRDLAELNVARERQRLETALKTLIDRGVVELHWVPGERWEDLHETLWQPPWHVFHFIGHGGFSATRGTGVLYMSNELGFARELSATDVGRLLGDHQPLRLAVLNSCETAQGDRTDVFSSTAATLVRRGTPAVVAMQFQITDDAAIQFSRVFYAAIAHGMPIDTAVAEARKAVALSVSNSYEWGTPVLFMRSPDGVLFDLPAGMDAREAVRRAVAETVPSQTPQLPPAPPTLPPAPSTLPAEPPTLPPPPPPTPAASTNGSPGSPGGVRYDPSGPQITTPWRPLDTTSLASGAKPRAMSALGVIGCAVLALAVLGVIAFIFYQLFLKPGVPPFLGEPASIFLSSTGGPVGARVSVSGTGFAPNEEVIIRFHTDQVVRTTANSEGAFTSVEFIVPTWPYGNFPGTQFQVTATGQSSIKTATAPYTVGG
jgi:hypothetical protein